MENSKINKTTELLIILSSTILILIVFLNIKNIKCSRYGDFVLDKLLGINSDCYERKVKGVVNPWVKNLDARYAYTKNKIVVECPKNSIVILVSGQSNASNFLRSKKRYNNKHLNYFNGKCYKLSNPVLGAEGEMSSLIPALASKLDKSKKIIFFTSGRGGMPMSHANHKNMIFINYNKNGLEELEKNNNILKFFIWIQGESDLGKSNSYIDNFEEMFENITKNLEDRKKINLIITQTSRCFNKEDSLLRNKQMQISINRNKLIKILNTDKLGNEFRYDKCHYNQKGIERISLDISKIIKRLLK
tara:strand:- start:12870 stop:13781 length:912 start_codon:yes stop_codon:yes gene_type:complete